MATTHLRRAAAALIAGAGLLTAACDRADPPPRATTATTRVTTAAAAPEVLEATEQAVEAWGRFAGTGDLELVRPYFVADGLQFARFVDEAPGIAQSPRAVSFRLVAARELTAPDRAQTRTLAATVEISRPEGRNEVRWQIVLLRNDNTWKVWVATVPNSRGPVPARGDGG